MKMEICDLSCGYAPGRPVLQNVKFAVETGEICCLLGANGIGKTTLFKSVLGLLPPLAGKVKIDGEDFAKWPARRRAKTIAYVPQSHVPPFPYLVRDVVLMGRTAHVGCFGRPSRRDRQIVEETINEMGLMHLQNQAYTDISGGERQLVLIAKALVQQPDFLMLDEPTANLDYGNTVKVLQKLVNLRRAGLGVIMTTHAPDQAFLCRAKTVLLQKDKSLLFGDADQVINDKTLCAAYDIQVHVLEYLDGDGRCVKLCSPVMQE